jgi:hypothetical protein
VTAALRSPEKIWLYFNRIVELPNFYAIRTNP